MPNIKDSTLVTIGGSGYVGQLFISRHSAEYRHPVDCSVDNGFDITNPQSVLAAVTTHNPDVIIIFAALTNTKPDPSQHDQYLAVNARGPGNVVEACLLNNATRLASGQKETLIVHVSTDQVYRGDRGPDYTYTESDVADATVESSGIYAGSKAAGEASIRAYPNHLIVRLGNPTSISEPPRSDYLRKIFESLVKNGKAMLFSNQFVTGSVTEDFVDALHELIRQGKTGVFNATGPECLSAYDWGVLLVTELGLTPSEITQFVIPTDVVVYNNQSTGYRFPVSLRLSNEKLVTETGFHPRSPREIMKEVVAGIPESRRTEMLQKLQNH